MFCLKNRILGTHRVWWITIKKSSSSSTKLKTFDELPGLSKLPLVGVLHHFLPIVGSIGIPSNFFKLSGTFHKKFGPLVKLDGLFGRVPMVLMFEPKDFEQIYRAEEHNPLRPGFDSLVYYRTVYRKERLDGVHGLTTAQNAEWRDFRTKVNPALLKIKLVKLYTPVLDEIAMEVVEKIKKVQSDGNYLRDNFDLEMTKFSLESVAYVALGTRLGCIKDNLTEDHPARQLIKCVRDLLTLPFQLEFGPEIVRYFSKNKFQKILDTSDLQWDISAKYIEEAKERINNRQDEVAEEDKSIIEKLLAIDERVAIAMANEMLLAGIDTVAFAATGLLYHLAVNQDKQDKLREEIRSGEGSRRYLKACLKENLRIWPVVSSNLRRTNKEYVVDGYLLPAGIEVIAPNEYLSKLEKHYPRPLEFIPERWIVEKTDPLYYGNAHPMVTLPFGFGVRSCIGRRIAELEIETLVARLVDEFRITWEGPPIKVITKILNVFEKPYNFKFESIK